MILFINNNSHANFISHMTVSVQTTLFLNEIQTHQYLHTIFICQKICQVPQYEMNKSCGIREYGKIQMLGKAQRYENQD